jgi:putative spermidine/putrescine transport system ATP-binding protein
MKSDSHAVLEAGRATERRSSSLQLLSLRKQFGQLAAIDDVSLDVAAGEFLTLLGSSGSGKSTTLMSVAGFVQPSAGQVLINGIDQTHTPPYRRDIGIVFQHYALFPHMTVEKNVAFPLTLRKLGRAEIKERVAKVLELVRLKGFSDRRPDELSGGQQQRVALARALVYEPSILLLDEPLGALDKNLREEMQFEIRRIQQTLGITTIAVTHDQQEAIMMSDRIAVMRAGRIEQIGSPAEIYERPASRFVAQFMGASNFLRGSVAVAGDPLQVRLGSGEMVPIARCASLPVMTVGTPVDIVIRPERLRLTARDHSTKTTLPARIDTIQYAGDAWRLSLVLDSGEALLALCVNVGELDARVGEQVSIEWNGAQVWAVPAAE